MTGKPHAAWRCGKFIQLNVFGKIHVLCLDFALDKRIISALYEWEHCCLFFYFNHILNAAAGPNVLSLLVQDGDSFRPKKKKKLMKKKTKRKGEDIQVYQIGHIHLLPFLKK